MPSRKSRSLLTGAYTRRHVLQAGGLLIPAAVILPEFVSSSALAATTFDFYISPAGSDNNPGTQSLPWAITALNSKRALYAGRNVGLLDGTYNVSSLLGSVTQDGYAPALDINGGTSLAPTVIASVNPQGAIISAKNGSTYGSAGGNPIMGHTDAVSQRGNVTIDGIVFTGASGKCLDFGSYGSASTGVRYPGFTVRNCEFKDCNAIRHGLGGNYSLVQIYGGSSPLVQNNYFHDNVGWQQGSADHHSAVLTWYTDRPTIEYNTIVNSANIFGKENGNQGVIVRYNYIDASMYTAGVAGILDFAGTPTTGLTAGNKYYNNVIVAMQGVDLCPVLSSGAATIPTAEIFNNTFVLANGGAIMAMRAWAQPRSVSFYNNLISGTPGWDPGTISTNVSAIKLSDYNFFPSSGMRWSTFPDGGSPGSRTGYDTVAAFRLATLLSALDLNTIFSGGALFASSGTNADRYKLQSSSPAKGKGRVGGTSGGAATDIGAWGNGATRIGCDFSKGTAGVQPMSPSLSVA